MDDTRVFVAVLVAVVVAVLVVVAVAVVVGVLVVVAVAVVVGVLVDVLVGVLVGGIHDEAAMTGALCSCACTGAAPCGILLTCRIAASTAMTMIPWKMK